MDDRFTLPKKLDLTGPNRGILYLGRVPNGMNSTDIRRALSSFNVERIHLNPRKKSSISKKETKRGGKRKKKLFKDGHIEFASAEEARRAQSLLNGQALGLGKKSSRTFYELWNLKYKPGLTWEVLVDKAVGRQKAKEMKIKAEFAKLEKKHDFISGNRLKSHQKMGRLKRQAKRELKKSGEWVVPSQEAVLKGRVDDAKVREQNKGRIQEKILANLNIK